MQARRLRRLAAYVLFAWLFALATGIVNACVVQAVSNPAQVLADGGGSAKEDVLHQAMVHDATGHSHDRQPDQGNPPCERFCDEPSVTTQAAKQQSDSAGGFWLASASAPPFHFAARADEAAARQGTPIRSGATIPIPIAFLRLTL